MNNKKEQKKIKIVYFGSSDFSIEPLKVLLNYTGIEVCTIVTKKDKKIGRSSSMQENIVAKFATKYGVPLVKVGSLRKNPFQLKGIFTHRDYAVVVSFGYILPKQILDQLYGKFVNLHTSLLPKYRGASQIQSSIINGDRTTGISTMTLNEGMDEGDVLKTLKYKIKANSTYSRVSKDLSKLGSTLLIDTITGLQKGSIVGKPQDHSKASYTNIIKKEDGFVTLSEKPITIYNKYRAYSTWPGIYTTIKDLEIFLGVTAKIDNKHTIIKLRELALKDNKLYIKYVQLPNKPVISLKDFYNGYIGK